MNIPFLRTFMDRTAFPPEAVTAFTQAAEELAAGGWGGEMDGAVEAFSAGGFSVPATQSRMEALAEKSGISPYTLWELLLIFSAEPVRESYLDGGPGETVFYDTFSDLRYKAVECREVKGVWGTFVAFWYPIFYTEDIVKLGRLEYESRPYRGPDFAGEGFTLHTGDMVRHIHIPSSGEPFDRAARLDSYRRAYRFFREELAGGPLVCVCHSWLLYPAYRPLLPEGSNVRSFMEDFHILEARQEERFDDAWRVFGAAGEGPAENWPEKTRMQRAFKRHVLGGGKVGSALGVLAFDGERLL